MFGHSNASTRSASELLASSSTVESTADASHGYSTTVIIGAPIAICGSAKVVDDVDDVDVDNVDVDVDCDWIGI